MSEITYKLQYDLNDKTKPCSIWRSDGWSIPLVENNADYQQYLKWLSEGNTPQE